MRKGLIVLIPLALATATPAFAGEEPAKPAEDAAPAEPEKVANEAEDKRICRYIRTDMSSRRKEKVCLTKEGWRELNNRR